MNMSPNLNNTRDESIAPVNMNASQSDSAGAIDPLTSKSSPRSTNEYIDSGVARKMTRAIRAINKDNQERFAIGKQEVKKLGWQRFELYEPVVDEVRFNYRVKEVEYSTKFLVFLAYFHPLRLTGFIILLNVTPLRAWVSITYLMSTAIIKSIMDVYYQTKKRIFRTSLTYGLSMFLEFQIAIVCLLLILPRTSDIGGLLAYMLVIFAPIDWLWYFLTVYLDYKTVKKIPNDNDYRVWKLGLLPLNGYRWYKEEAAGR